MSRTGPAVGLLCALSCLLWPASSLAGPVVYLTQAREVEATLTEEWRFPDQAPTVLSHTESASATDFAEFDRSVTAVIPPAAARQDRRDRHHDPPVPPR